MNDLTSNKEFSITWSRKLVKGNSKGSGWITLPKDNRKDFLLQEYYKVTLQTETNEKIVVTLKSTTNKITWGFYIPKNICKEKKLLGTILNVSISPLIGFPCIIAKDQRIRIPNKIVLDNRIKINELYKIELRIGNEKFQEVVIIKSIDRTNRNREDEYYYTIRMQKIPTQIDAVTNFKTKIEIIKSNINFISQKEIYIPDLFNDAILGKMSENSMIIFMGNNKPIITPIIIKIDDFAHYFGCYYADGTKKGHSWRINASTKEQGIYYLKCYNDLIKNEELKFELTYTDKSYPYKKDPKELFSYWSFLPNNRLNQIKKIQSISLESRNWNPFGSLGIRDYRGLIIILHNRILDLIIIKIKDNANINAAWSFLFGILEGDGYISGGNTRFGIGIASNTEDDFIESLLNILSVTYHIDNSKLKDGKSKGIEIKFGLFEILIQANRFFQNSFSFYPKRRKIFIERILIQPTVLYLLNRKDSISSYSLNFLNNQINKQKTHDLLLKLEIELNNSLN